MIVFDDAVAHARVHLRARDTAAVSGTRGTAAQGCVRSDIRSGYCERGGRGRRRKAEIELIVDAAPETVRAQYEDRNPFPDIGGEAATLGRVAGERALRDGDVARDGPERASPAG